MPARRPEDMAQVWSEAFNRGDVDALVALYEPAATLVRRSGPPLYGRDAIREAFTAIVAGAPRIEATTRKVLESGDVALTFGDWTLRAASPDGTTRTVTGRSAEVLRRQPDGTWRHVIDDPFAG
jgi:uncharacterized protein (TIGR02246 family)